MIVRFILVGIEGSFNLGLIARTCMNFKIDELFIVESRVDLSEAFKYAANAYSYLSKAIFTDCLTSALKNCDLIVATSAIGYSPGDVVRQAISIEEFVENIRGFNGRLAVLFGRESTGLTRNEISKADILVTIPANPEYSVLNISQSVAIIAWELWKLRELKAVNIPPKASRDEIDQLNKLIYSVSHELFKTIDKIERLQTVWRRVLYRSHLSKYECKLLEYWFRRLNNKLKRTNKNIS
ncbi:MAG: TrmH family RNA methyltransferase [Desulfurococcaceae archaeon]